MSTRAESKKKKATTTTSGGTGRGRTRARSTASAAAAASTSALFSSSSSSSSSLSSIPQQKKRSASPTQTKKFAAKQHKKKQHREEEKEEQEVDEMNVEREMNVEDSQEEKKRMTEASQEKKEKKKAERKKREEEERTKRIEAERLDHIKRKKEAKKMKERAMLIEANYSDEVKLAVRSHLINSRHIDMPNVLADLILEYSHHPLLTLWESIEIECQQVHDPRRHAEGEVRPPLLPIYTAGNHNKAQVDALAVSYEEVSICESQYRLKLNDPSFTLPEDLKILWSIRDGFSSHDFEPMGKCLLQDQHLLSTYPFPSLAMIRAPLSSALSPLHAQYHFMETFRDGALYMKKLHLPTGVIYATKWEDEEEEEEEEEEDEEEEEEGEEEGEEDADVPTVQMAVDGSSTAKSSTSDVSSKVARLLRSSPPTIIFHSLYQYLKCLQLVLSTYSDEAADADDNHPACWFGDLIERAADNLTKKSRSRLVKVLHSPPSVNKSIGADIRGHLSQTDLRRIELDIIAAIELPILTEIISHPPIDKYESRAEEYYTNITEEHGTPYCRTY